MSDAVEIRKSILILKSQPKNLAAVETFLRNRDWHIHATCDLKSALVYLVQHKPSFVMISVDHPNKKVRNLPKLLKQAFPVFVMAFSEASGTASYKNLLDCGTNYKINPPVTGPAVERTINKIIRDQQIAQEQKERAARGEGEGFGQVSGTDKNANGSPGSVNILGSSEAGGDAGPLGVGGGPLGGSNSAADLIRQMMGEIDEPDGADASGSSLVMGQDAGGAKESLLLDPAADEKKSSGPGGASLIKGEAGDPSTMSTGSPGSLGQPGGFGGAGHQGGPSYMPNHQSGKAQAKNGTWEPIDEKPDGEPLGLNKSERGKAGNKRNEHHESEGNPESQGPSFLGGMGGKRNTHGKNAHGQKEGEKAPQPQYSEEDIEGAGSSGDAPGFAPQFGGGASAKKSGATEGPESLVPTSLNEDLEHDPRKTFSQDVHHVSKRQYGTDKNDNVMVRGTQQALDETVTVKAGHRSEDTVKVESSTNVACLVIESPKFSGYLVAALGKNRQVDEKFVNMIRDRLFKFLRDNGEQINGDDTMSLKIKKVDFEDWALEYADFLRKSVHNGEEIAMAFFPFAEAKTEMEESASVDMGAVKIDDLKGDVQVEFNLYIYMPANKRYVLYTPRNSVFYGNQKDRLAKMGVTHMHVKREELQDVCKYRAQVYLNEKIDEYENRRNSGTGSAA